jgi:predicted RND superfamily exporter protein
VRAGRDNPRSVVAAAAAAWVLAGVLAFQVRIETDLLSLVPDENPVVEAFRTTVERFGSVDTLLVVVHLEPERPLAQSVDFADRFAAALRDWEAIDWVEYRVDSSAEAAIPLLDRAALFLDPAELEEFLAELDDGGLDRTAARLRSQLTAPQAMVTKDFLRLDPAGLLPRILARVRFGGIGVRLDPETGCLIDPGRKYLLMMAKPAKPAADLQFGRELVAGLAARAESVSRLWREEFGVEAAPLIEFTGSNIVALEDGRLITSDMVVGLVSSLVGVMLLFLLAFRSRAALAYAFFPLVTGIALTFSFGALALGRINSLTSAFGGLVIGLGIDFVIVLYARYVEERGRGAGHAEAVDAMGRHTGIGVLLGAVTTAATFYSFLVTDFAGLWELGLLTGTGILLLVLTVYLMLPALLSLVEGRRGAAHRPLHLHSFGSDVLCRLSLRRPRATIVLAVVATAALALGLRGLRWDDNFANMRSSGNRAIQVRQQVMDAFDLRFSPMMLRFDGASEAEALAKCRSALPAIEALIDGENLVGVDTIAGVIPPLEVQEAVIARLAAEEPALAGLRGRFESALRGRGLNPAGFATGLDHLETALGRRQPLSLADLGGTPLARVVDRYVVTAGAEVSAAIYLYPPDGRWRQGASPALMRVVESQPGAALAGVNVISAELRRIVWDDAIRALILGLVLVFLLMWADLGGVRGALLALLPLMLGLVWMLGAMALLGFPFNFFNIFVLTMVVGIGVDYGVHLLHRWRETGGDREQVGETAKAIAVAALTTVVGFGSLVLSHFPGLRSVGAAAILGALATAVLGITLLPALLAMKERPHDP